MRTDPCSSSHLIRAGSARGRSVSTGSNTGMGGLGSNTGMGSFGDVGSNTGMGSFGGGKQPAASGSGGGYGSSQYESPQSPFASAPPVSPSTPPLQTEQRHKSGGGTRQRHRQVSGLLTHTVLCLARRRKLRPETSQQSFALMQRTGDQCCHSRFCSSLLSNEGASMIHGMRMCCYRSCHRLPRCHQQMPKPAP